MITDKYLLPEELREIADLCEAAQPIWNALISATRDKVSVECDSFELKVYDSTGDYIGVITWGDNGAAFYLDNGDDAQPQ